MFLQQLDVLYQAVVRQGQSLILRDHSHSHFCTNTDPGARPTMGAMLAGQFQIRALVTVRHPLDSFLSLHESGWGKAVTSTLEGYAASYQTFLNSYRDTPLRYYEHFTDDPDGECRDMARTLALDFNPHWQDILPSVQLSGDSGRKAQRIRARPRRPLPDALRETLTQDSPAYEELCARLGYNPDPESNPMPRN